MTAWLNANAGAIQALSSALGVVITAVLVIITARYVGLTKTLAEAANAQSKAWAAALEARRRELKSMVSILSSALESVPAAYQSADADRNMRNAISIDDFDFGRFRQLASEQGPKVGEAAKDAESHMKWIAERVKEVKGTPPERGYAWTRFDWERWSNARVEAERAIINLAQALNV